MLCFGEELQLPNLTTLNTVATCRHPEQATKHNTLVLRQEACELVQYTDAKLQRAQGYLQLLADRARTLRESLAVISEGRLSQGDLTGL